MTTMFVRHQVSDYAAWRQAYDDFDAARRDMGVTAHAVYQADGDPNDLTIVHDFASVDAARQFAESEDLRNAMQRAGVLSKPTIWFTERA
jgi:hypothetical protein